MAYLTYILIVLSLIAFPTVNTRSIKEEEAHVEQWVESEYKGLSGKAAGSHHRSGRHKSKTHDWTLSEKADSPYCEFCAVFIPTVRYLIETNSTDKVESAIITVCRDTKPFHDANVCIGVIHEYQDAIIEILRVSPLTDKEICALAFNCKDQMEFRILQWNVTIPGSKPNVTSPQPPRVGSPTLKVLHISDIHVDFAYKPGSLANCPQPLCCRQDKPKLAIDAAGFWGDYRNCDLPIWTAQAFLQYAHTTEQFDFVYYTGDLPPHNVWNQSRADQLYSLNTINQLLAITFPNKTFYPAVGNHEAAPCNLFPTPIVRTDNITWLYEALADSWIKLGLPNDTRTSILRGAFYTTIVRPGLRLISLNTNYYAPDNYWLFINSTDPLDQLQWLVQWLQYAEDHKEKVHIIGHHPPRSCLAEFGWNFHRIVNRYENTITGQFYGHTHKDEFVVFYDEINRQRPVSLAYITPSLTTNAFLNPGYRMYTVDGHHNSSSYWVLDHRTVIMNLTATNAYNRTVILNEYEARNAYQMQNLFPADWNNLIQQMENDIDGPLMGLVYTYYTKSYANGTECDHSCRRSLLCNFKTARADDPHACDSIPA